MLILNLIEVLLLQNKIRKQLAPDYYPPLDLSLDGNFRHIDHCVDSIRQSLMCASDVSTVVWQKIPDINEEVIRIHSDVLHTCRNFDKIRQWAVEHRLDVPFNMTGRMEDRYHVP